MVFITPIRGAMFYNGAVRIKKEIREDADSWRKDYESHVPAQRAHDVTLVEETG